MNRKQRRAEEHSRESRLRSFSDRVDVVLDLLAAQGREYTFKSVINGKTYETTQRLSGRFVASTWVLFGKITNLLFSGNDVAWAGIRWFAKKSKHSMRWVFKHLRVLCAIGVVKRRHHFKQGERRPKDHPCASTPLSDDGRCFDPDTLRTNDYMLDWDALEKLERDLGITPGVLSSFRPGSGASNASTPAPGDARPRSADVRIGEALPQHRPNDAPPRSLADELAAAEEAERGAELVLVLAALKKHLPEIADAKRANVLLSMGKNTRANEGAPEKKTATRVAADIADASNRIDPQKRTEITAWDWAARCVGATKRAASSARPGVPGTRTVEPEAPYGAATMRVDDRSPDQIYGGKPSPEATVKGGAHIGALLNIEGRHDPPIRGS